MVEVVLLIASDGKIGDCMIVETSGVPTLDATVCILIHTRARFAPAIGGDGKPTRGAIAQRVRWELP